jgi:hypothetical protein
MLTVEIKLHSARTGKVKTLATGTIINTGTGETHSGNYRIELRDAAGRKWKTGTVEGFPRKRLLAWDLLHRALEKLLKNRNSTPKTRQRGKLLDEGTNQPTESVI